MAKPKGSPTTQEHREPTPKRTSIGDGRRKRGSYAKQRTKPMRGQGR